jgi:hypothetical protein
METMSFDSFYFYLHSADISIAHRTFVTGSVLNVDGGFGA